MDNYAERRITLESDEIAVIEVDNGRYYLEVYPDGGSDLCRKDGTRLFSTSNAAWYDWMFREKIQKRIGF